MRNLFTRVYDAIMLWAKSKHAVSILSTVSFVESFIFPIPPDLLLIPLSISNPKKAYYFAFRPFLIINPSTERVHQAPKLERETSK